MKILQNISLKCKIVPTKNWRNERKNDGLIFDGYYLFDIIPDRLNAVIRCDRIA